MKPKTKRVPGRVLTAWSGPARESSPSGGAVPIFALLPRYHAGNSAPVQGAGGTATARKDVEWLEVAEADLGRWGEDGLPANSGQVMDPGASSEEALDFSPRSLRGVLGELQFWLERVREDYDDVSGRHVAWSEFQRQVSERLWEAVEDLEDDLHRQELADQLDVAVNKIDWSQLQEAHVDVAEKVLQRLSARTVTEDDVEATRLEWRSAGAETLPSFGDILGELLEHYEDRRRGNGG